MSGRQSVRGSRRGSTWIAGYRPDAEPAPKSPAKWSSRGPGPKHPSYPFFWRVCQLHRAERVGDLNLDPGWWVLGFAAPPTSSSRPFVSATEVDRPDGAIVAIRVYVSERATDDPRAPYRWTISFEIAKELEHYGRRLAQMNPTPDG